MYVHTSYYTCVLIWHSTFFLGQSIAVYVGQSSVTNLVLADFACALDECLNLKN